MEDELSTFYVSAQFPEAFSLRDFFLSLKGFFKYVNLVFNKNHISVTETSEDNMFLANIDIDTNKLRNYWFINRSDDPTLNSLTVIVDVKCLTTKLCAAKKGKLMVLSVDKKNTIRFQVDNIVNEMAAPETQARPWLFSIPKTNIYRCFVSELHQICFNACNNKSDLIISSINYPKETEDQGISFTPIELCGKKGPITNITRDVNNGYHILSDSKDEVFEIRLEKKYLSLLTHISKWADQHTVVSITGGTKKTGTEVYNLIFFKTCIRGYGTIVFSIKC